MWVPMCDRSTVPLASFIYIFVRYLKLSEHCANAPITIFLKVVVDLIRIRDSIAP
jgi:hypothetical protein